MGPHKLKSLCKAKDNVSRTKQESTDWEKIFNNRTSVRGLISKIFKYIKKIDSRELKLILIALFLTWISQYIKNHGESKMWVFVCLFLFLSFFGEHWDFNTQHSICDNRAEMDARRFHSSRMAYLKVDFVSRLFSSRSIWDCSGGWAGIGRPASSSCGRPHTHHPPWSWPVHAKASSIYCGGNLVHWVLMLCPSVPSPSPSFQPIFMSIC
jgi:hypothetical protein